MPRRLFDFYPARCYTDRAEECFSAGFRAERTVTIGFIVIFFMVRKQANHMEKTFRPVVLQGVVIHGKGVGGPSGFPTANLELEPGKHLPKERGVYASFADIDGQRFVGVTNIIPFFGPFLGAIPSFFLILLVDPIKSLYFLLFVLALQQLDGNFIGPKILGNRTGLSGFWVMFSIILFGGLWGIVGMIICVPLFAVIYDTVRRLVRRGLRRRNHTELWDEYRVQFPDSGADSAAKEKKQE